MKLVKILISIIPFLTCLTFLSDFISDPNQIETTIKKKNKYYHQRQGKFDSSEERFYLNFGEQSMGVSEEEFNLFSEGEIVIINVGKISKTTLSLINKSGDLMIKSKDSFSMFLLMIGILSCSLLSVVDFKNLENKFQIKEATFWIIYAVGNLVGYGLTYVLIQYLTL